MNTFLCDGGNMTKGLAQKIHHKKRLKNRRKRDIFIPKETL